MEIEIDDDDDNDDADDDDSANADADAEGEDSAAESESDPPAPNHANPDPADSTPADVNMNPPDFEPVPPRALAVPTPTSVSANLNAGPSRSLDHPSLDQPASSQMSIGKQTAAPVTRPTGLDQDPDRATESEAEDERRSQAENSDGIIEPPLCPRPRSVAALYSHSKGPGPSIRPSLASSHNQSAIPASQPTRAVHPLPSTSAARPSSSATLPVGVAQLNPLASPAARLLGRDAVATLNSLLGLALGRLRLDNDENASAQAGPSSTNSGRQSGAGSSGVAPRGIAPIPSRVGRQPVTNAVAPPSQQMDVDEEPAEVLERAAAALLGKARTVCLSSILDCFYAHRLRQTHKKPALSDFPGIRHQIALAAIPAMQVTAITENAYTLPGMFEEWAREAYQLMWHCNLPNHLFQPLLDNLVKAVSCVCTML
jgi:hypothetical protein